LLRSFRGATRGFALIADKQNKWREIEELNYIPLGRGARPAVVSIFCHFILCDPEVNIIILEIKAESKSPMTKDECTLLR